MAKLPKMPYRDQITKSVQIQFGGLHHSVQCGEGQVYDMDNMSCEDLPYIKARGKRSVAKRITQQKTGMSQHFSGTYIHNGDVVYAYGSMLWYNDLPLAWNLEPEQHEFIKFGDRVILLPEQRVINMKYHISGIVETEGALPTDDMDGMAYAVPYKAASITLYYNIYVKQGGSWISNGRFDLPMDAEIKAAPGGIGFGSGELFGEYAYGSQLYIMLSKDYITDVIGIKVGDAVTIKGCSVPENNKTAVVREISGDDAQCYLRFTAYTFSEGYGETPTEGDAIWWQDTEASVGRYAPKMEGVFEQGNRLWGYRGKEIWASAMGDPTNWYVFDGTAADSWYMMADAKGDIRGGFDAGSYPAFLTNDSIIIIYGTMPSAYQMVERIVPGLKSGEQRSIISAAGMRFWISDDGPVAYNGEIYQVMTDIFGDWPHLHIISGATAGQRGYWLAQLDEDVADLLVYDGRTGQWTKEIVPEKVKSILYDNGIAYAEVRHTGAEEEMIELLKLYPYSDQGTETVATYLEFGDMISGSPNVKAINRLQLRIGMEANAEVTIKIRYDDEVTEIIKTISTGAKRKANIIVPVRPRRCDHYRLIFEGTGQWMLWSMAKEYYIGSDKNR